MLRYNLQQTVTTKWQKQNQQEAHKKFHSVKKVTRLKKDTDLKNKNQKGIVDKVDKMGYEKRKGLFEKDDV